MIQRIQTLWLALAAVCMAVLFISPENFAKITTTAADGAVSTTHFMTHWPSIIILAATILIIICCIFLFKNRPQQIRIGALAILDVALFWGITHMFSSNFQKNNPGSVLTYDWAAALPILALIFLILAVFSIRKDEKLVESSNRLR
jgi:uncharacterized BrkB/YihY/UPF0761 family membrane protein